MPSSNSKRNHLKKSPETTRKLPDTILSKRLEAQQAKALETLESPISSVEQYLVDFISFAFERKLGDSISDIIQKNEFQEKAQLIKRLFFERDFVTLFSDKSLLLVYAMDYVPYRSLCYRDIFLKQDFLNELMDNQTHEKPNKDAETKTNNDAILQILSLGSGNGAELVGLAGSLFGRSTTTIKKINLLIQDLSSYGDVVPLFQDAIHHWPGMNSIPLSASLLDTGNLLDPRYLETTLKQVCQGSQFITAMFVLNELLTTSKKGFMQLVMFLVKYMRPGTFLLVVDSAGSFSEVSLGSQHQTRQDSDNTNSNPSPQRNDTSSTSSNRTYMLFQLLDAIQVFRICESHDAVWYRFPKTVSTPMKLQNMRYFLRLYQRK